jgi:hypothetical protein
MTSQREIEQVIVRLAAPYQRRGRSITPFTTLNRELGIDGDDAVRFLQEVSRLTGMSLKSSFEFEDYFGDEPTFSYREIIKMLKGPRTKDLTVRELAAQFEKGETQS